MEPQQNSCRTLLLQSLIFCLACAVQLETRFNRLRAGEVVRGGTGYQGRSAVLEDCIIRSELTV